MERYYLVKTVSKATPANHSYGGETHTYIHGKDGFLLFADTKDPFVNRDCMTPYFVRQKGFTKESDARRAYSFKHPENTEYWRSTAEIIAVEIHNGFGKEYLV